MKAVISLQILRRSETLLFVILLICLGVFGSLDPTFLSIGNLTDIAQQSAVITIVSLSMTAVIISRGIDISIGGILAFSGVAAGLVLQATGSTLICVIVALLSGSAVGLLNGVLIGWIGISPFMATLATMAFGRGLALSLSAASSIPVADPFIIYLGSGSLGPIPMSVVVALLCVGVWWFILTRTKYGRWIYAVGGNAPAARASLVPVSAVRISVYLLAGLTAGLCAILTIGRLGSAQPLAGTGLEFTAITAAVIGGSKLSGGQGSVLGTALGALLLGVINTGLSFLEVSQIFIYFVTASLILIAVLLTQPEAITRLLKRRPARILRLASLDVRTPEIYGAHRLDLVGVGKDFPGVRALEDITFSICSGEVVALVGENGAGKSTLVKCLSGLYQPDQGEILLDNLPAKHRPSHEAGGIRVIHQHFSQAPDLSVAENLFIGQEPRTYLGLLDRSRMRRDARNVMSELNLDVNVNAEIGTLPVGQRQMVEIARAVLSDANFLIMDEPTSALSNRERDLLFGLISRLKRRGAGILYISHKMEEVFSECDRLVVLRDGRFIGERNTSSTNEAEVISMMVGRDVVDVFPYVEAKLGATVLSIDSLSDGQVLKSATLSVRSGEIVAVTGLMGSGRSEVLRLIAGLRKPSAGTINLFGKGFSGSRTDASRLGVAYVPEDRHLEGIVGTMSIRDNLSLVWIQNNSRFGILRTHAVAALATRLMSSLRVRPSQPQKLVRELSGGNQQKVVIGKWLATQPMLLLLDEPTQGVDVGAKSELHELIAAFKSQGMAILMVSSELPEVLGVADRIFVMRGGRTVGELKRGADEKDVMRLAFGEAQSSFKVAAITRPHVVPSGDLPTAVSPDGQGT